MKTPLLRPKTLFSGKQRLRPLLRGPELKWRHGRSWVRGRGRPISTKYSETDESQLSYLPPIEPKEGIEFGIADIQV